MSLTVKTQILHGARCIVPYEGEEFTFDVGDVFDHPIDGLVRIHYVHTNGDAFWRPLTLAQRLRFYWRKIIGRSFG